MFQTCEKEKNMINYIKQYLGSIIATSFFLCATYFSIYDNSQNSKINNQMSLNQYTVFAEQNIKNEAPSGISSISAIKEKSEYMKIKTDLLAYMLTAYLLTANLHITCCISFTNY